MVRMGIDATRVARSMESRIRQATGVDTTFVIYVRRRQMEVVAPLSDNYQLRLLAASLETRPEQLADKVIETLQAIGFRREANKAIRESPGLPQPKISQSHGS